MGYFFNVKTPIFRVASQKKSSLFVCQSFWADLFTTDLFFECSLRGYQTLSCLTFFVMQLWKVKFLHSKNGTWAKNYRTRFLANKIENLKHIFLSVCVKNKESNQGQSFWPSWARLSLATCFHLGYIPFTPHPPSIHPTSPTSSYSLC